MATNLPSKTIEDNAAGTVIYFDRYGDVPLEFSAVDVSASVGFFTAAGFEDDAAQISAMTLLRQAKIDQVPIFQILDTIGGFDSKQLSQLVSEILNNDRVATSTLGFRVADVKTNKSREISA